MLRPTMTMSDVYGPDHIFAPRAHDATCEWLPHGASVLDSLTGNQLSIAGEMPVVCSAGFNTAAGLELMALAGLPPARASVHFRAGGHLDAISQALTGPRDKLVLQHVFPPQAWQSERCWIDPALLSYLNNKGNLSALSPADHTPERKVVDPAEFFAADQPSLPIVLKIATDQSSGGGLGVIICRNSEDLCRARQMFGGRDPIVAEAVLDIDRNPCLNFAALSPTDVRYLGFAEQEVSAEGRYLGNWMDAVSSLPREVVDPALEIVRRAAAMGYRGFAGVDVALTRDGQIYVLDLNFRLNASTASVLFAPSIIDRMGAVTLHLRRLQGPGSAEQFAQSLEPLVRRQQLVPLSFFDAHAAGYPGKPPVAQALIVNSSKREVLETESTLVEAGIV